MDLLKAWNYIVVKMKQYQHVLGLILTCLVLLLRFMPSKNQSTDLETRSAVLPRTVLSNGSKVLDSWIGNLKLREYMIERSEICLVFYYAPWCARSIDALREVEKVAKVMSKQVSFVAINCWWIRGDCRGQMKFNEYPQVFLHHKNMKQDVAYNGPLREKHVLYFLKKLMSPVTYLGTGKEVIHFLDENQVTVLATFSPISFKGTHNLMYYSMIAINQMETYDFPVSFGIVTDEKLARKYYLKPNILQIRNRLKPRQVVHISLLSTMEEILKSLQKFKKHLVSPDLDFPGTKSDLLFQTIHKGPTLIIFVSSSSVEKRENYIKKIRQLVIQYSHCTEKVSSLPNRATYTNNHSPDNQCCQTVLFENHSTVSLACSICAKQENVKKIVHFAYCDLIHNFIDKINYKNAEWARNMQRKIFNSENAVICEEILANYGIPLSSLSICCESKNSLVADLQNHILQKRQDICVDDILQKMQKFSSISTENGETVISDTSEIDDSVLFTDNSYLINENTDNVIRGISCNTNRTLQFLTLDFDRHKKLYENLGVESRHVYHVGDVKMGAVIYDPINELRHVMSSSHFHLENFIINYTLGILPRNYHTSEKTPSCFPTQTQPCIQDVTSANFKDIVLDNEKDVLLLYYAPWCAACTSVSHIYLSLAQLLHPVSSIIVARIDAYENELPSQFSVQRYPTLIIFPAKRSSYSAVFPQDLDITVANLLWFLLKNISWESTQSILYNLCTSGNCHPTIQKHACIQWNAIKSKS